jgi:hypothetical protein
MKQSATEIFEEISFDYTDENGATHIDAQHLNSDEGETIGWIFGTEVYWKDNDRRLDEPLMNIVKEFIAERAIQHAVELVEQDILIRLGTLVSEDPEEALATLKAYTDIRYRETSNLDTMPENIGIDLCERYEYTHTVKTLCDAIGLNIEY